MKVISYVRVSTTDQADRYGPARQRTAITTWARRHKHRVVAEVFEDISGTVPVAGRDGWCEAVARVCSGEAEGIVVADLSRLSRHLVTQETALLDLTDCGAVLCSTVEQEQQGLTDPDDPDRTLIRQIFGAVAQHDRAKIVARLQAGRRLKKAAGGYAGGQPPFGYRGGNGTKELVPDEREQSVLARMLQLHNDGISTRAIAEDLNAAGLLNRKDGRWLSASVARLVKRESAALA